MQGKDGWVSSTPPSTKQTTLAPAISTPHELTLTRKHKAEYTTRDLLLSIPYFLSAPNLFFSSISPKEINFGKKRERLNEILDICRPVPEHVSCQTETIRLPPISGQKKAQTGL